MEVTGIGSRMGSGAGAGEQDLCPAVPEELKDSLCHCHLG